MAFEKTYCANADCPKHTVYSGGRFVYSAEKKAFFCEECFRVPTVFNAGRNLWEFTTTHFTGEAIRVKSLSHLRDLEKQYGCSNHAANYDSARWSEPPPIKPHTIHPNLQALLRGQ